jgi:hypothetical protein
VLGQEDLTRIRISCNEVETMWGILFRPVFLKLWHSVKTRTNSSISRMASSGMLRRVALVRTDVSSVAAHLAFLRSVRRLLVTASVAPSSPIVTLMKEALSYSETSVLTRATRRNKPEDAILHSHSRDNLKSYICSIRRLQASD